MINKLSTRYTAFTLSRTCIHQTKNIMEKDWIFYCFSNKHKTKQLSTICTHTWLFLLVLEALSAFLWILALPYALFSANTTVGSSVCLQKGIDSGHSVETYSLYILCKHIYLKNCWRLPCINIPCFVILLASFVDDESNDRCYQYTKKYSTEQRPQGTSQATLYNLEFGHIFILTIHVHKSSMIVSGYIIKLHIWLNELGMTYLYKRQIRNLLIWILYLSDPH